MRTIYVLDTSALIYNPTAWKSFPYSEVVIPHTVTKELDKLKKQPGETGRNARVAIKQLEEISQMGDISTGIELDDHILLIIDPTHYNSSDPEYAGFGDPNYGDTHILMCLKYHHKTNPSDAVTLISNDLHLRLDARMLGIDASPLDDKKKSSDELYSGFKIITDEEIACDLQAQGTIDSDVCGDLFPSECVILENKSGDCLAMGRKISSGKVKLIKKAYPWNLSARNDEQSILIDLIMDKNIDLVTVIGQAGTGKTLVALASALELVINKREYEKIIVYRPIQAVGNDLGFLPGEMSEKLAPWFQAIMDNFEFLFSNKSSNSDWKKELEMFRKKGRIELNAITYIRGRSIPNSIIMVDEAQNLCASDMKTILTRAGENTKIILTGDLDQIDNDSLDATNNGLVYIIDKFKESELSGHVTLSKGERSRLASAAAKIL